jgi:pimeloyl-ACP methyl ester carboxylesterase
VTIPRRFASILGPAIVVLMALSTSVTSGASEIERRVVEDPLFGVTSVVPADWQELGSGTYARGTPPQDLALVAIQSAPAPRDQLWPSLLPQFALDEVPEVTGQLESERFAWTLYRFNVTLGDVTLAVELAMADDEGATHLVLLQSDPAGFDVLREEVLLPAIEAFAVLEPEPTPDPATLGFEAQEVSFAGGSEGVELAGTLTLPPGPGPHPAVVLMSGSGAQDRDESIRPVATIKPFALIAEALTPAGVAVLRYDDRGVGGSSGDYQAATIQELAGDGQAAIDYLRGRDDIDPARIGVIGHSEGGLYAAMLAAKDPDIAFVVGMAAPAPDGVTRIVAQNEAISRAAGQSEEEIEHARVFAAEAMPLARDGDAEGLEASVRDYFEGLWERQPDEARTILGDQEDFAQRQVESALTLYLSDWFRSFLAYDPAPDWQQVTVPVLAFFGGRDVQVPAEQNERALTAVLAAGGNHDVSTMVLPEANHLFQDAETGAVAEYGTLAAEFTPAFLPDLVGWVTERAGVTE